MYHVCTDDAYIMTNATSVIWISLKQRDKDAEFSYGEATRKTEADEHR